MVVSALPTPPPADWRATFDAYAAAAPAAGGPGVGLREVSRPNWALDGLGTALLFSGLIPTFIAGIDLANRPACNGWGGAYFVPVIGGLIGGSGFVACDIPHSYWSGSVIPSGDETRIAATAFIGAPFQIAGLIVLIVGLANPSITRVAGRAGLPRVRFDAGGGAAGLTVEF